MLQNKNNNEIQHMHIMYNTMTSELSIHHVGLKETDSHTHTHTHTHTGQSQIGTEYKVKEH